MTQDTPQRDCPDIVQDFDAICDLFTSYARTVANWQQHYYGAAYSSRLKQAIADMKFVITEAEKHPEIGGVAQGAADCGEPIAWRTRWRTGSERDREWEMWTYRTEQPVPNDNQIIEPLYAAPQPASIAYPSWQPIETAPRDGTWLLVWETGINTKYHPSEIARFVNGRWETSAMKYVNAVAWQSAPVGPLVSSPQSTTTTRNLVDSLCDDCPPVGYETDKTRCLVCPRGASQVASTDREGSK